MPILTRAKAAAPGLAVAATTLGVEAVALLAFAIVQLAQVNGSASIAAGGIAFAGCAVFLAMLARAVFRGRRWSRGPAVVTQLIQLPIAWTLREPPTAWVAGGLAVTAILTLVSLLLPSSTAVLVPPQSAEKPDSTTGKT